MSEPRTPDPGQAFVSLLSSCWDRFWPELLVELEKRLGPADFLSDPLPFENTGYYDDELGTPITRRLVAFERLLALDELADIKWFAAGLEKRYACPDGRRIFNLDPGIVTLERVVLATFKNFTHRIYQGRCVWADLTLVFTQGDWMTMPWTFPDYGAGPLRDHMTALRRACMQKLTALR